MNNLYNLTWEWDVGYIIVTTIWNIGKILTEDVILLFAEVVQELIVVPPEPVIIRMGRYKENPTHSSTLKVDGLSSVSKISVTSVPITTPCPNISKIKSKSDNAPEDTVEDLINTIRVEVPLLENEDHSFILPGFMILNPVEKSKIFTVLYSQLTELHDTAGGASLFTKKLLGIVLTYADGTIEVKRYGALFADHMMKTLERMGDSYNLDALAIEEQLDEYEKRSIEEKGRSDLVSVEVYWQSLGYVTSVQLFPFVLKVEEQIRKDNDVPHNRKWYELVPHDTKKLLHKLYRRYCENKPELDCFGTCLYHLVKSKKINQTVLDTYRIIRPSIEAKNFLEVGEIKKIAERLNISFSCNIHAHTNGIMEEHSSRRSLLINPSGKYKLPGMVVYHGHIFLLETIPSDRRDLVRDYKIAILKTYKKAVNPENVSKKTYHSLDFVKDLKGYGLLRPLSTNELIQTDEPIYKSMDMDLFDLNPEDDFYSIETSDKLHDKWSGNPSFCKRSKSGIEVLSHLTFYLDTETCNCTRKDRKTGKKVRYMERFCLGFMEENDVKARVVSGMDCVERVLKHIAARVKKDVKANGALIYYHNLGFDWHFIVRTPGVIVKSALPAGMKRCKLFDFVFNGVYFKCKDTLGMINCSLDAAAKAYGAKSYKAPCPYSLYTFDNCFTPEMEVKEHIPWVGALEACKKEDRDEFLKISKPYRFMKDGKMMFRHTDYYIFYCARDVEVLRDTYSNFRKEAIKTFGMDPKAYLTISQYADCYMKKSGAYRGVCYTGGLCREFMQKCCVGGRVMTANNEMIVAEGKISDDDGNSLYPSSIERVKLPTGIPKCITLREVRDMNKIKDPVKRTQLLLENYPFFNFEITITKMGIRRSFPAMSTKTKDGRSFSNDFEDKLYYVNELDLADWVKWHKIDYYIRGGLYWSDPDGYTTKHQEVIRNLYNLRVQYKNNGNGVAQLLVKLIMNSIYGKTILKPIVKKYSYVHDIDSEKGATKYKKMLARHFRKLETATVYKTYDRKCRSAIIEYSDNKLLHSNLVTAGCRMMGIILIG